MADVGGTTIRPWEGRDRERVQALLKVLSQSAVVRNEDAPTYVAERDGRIVGMVTLCILRTLTGPKGSPRRGPGSETTRYRSGACGVRH